MTLREFIEQAGNIKESLLDKEVVIQAPNGLLFEPKIKFLPKKGTVSFDVDNMDKAIITFD